VRRGDRQHDPIGLDKNRAAGQLRQSFNVDVRVAVDLPDCGVDGLSVQDEGFIGRALRGEISRKRQNKSQAETKSQSVMFFHNVRPTGFPPFFEWLQALYTDVPANERSG